MNNKNEEKIKCVFHMKSGLSIEKRISNDAFDSLLNVFKTNREGLLEIFDEMQESTTIIKIHEIQALKYWN